MPWLLDTNVLSELRKAKADVPVVEFLRSLPLTQLYVSVVSLAEIRYGSERSTDDEKRIALQGWLDLQVRPMFSRERTLPMELGRKTGHTFSEPDLLIAATAANRGLGSQSR